MRQGREGVLQQRIFLRNRKKSDLVTGRNQWYNESVTSSGRSAVSAVSEVSGLTLNIPGTHSGW